MHAGVSRGTQRGGHGACRLQSGPTARSRVRGQDDEPEMLYADSQGNDPEGPDQANDGDGPPS